MRIRYFEWDNKNVDHIQRHNVDPLEVEEVILFNKPLYQRSKEGKYVGYGVTEAGRYLFIVFVVKKGECIRVITARNMVNKEKQYYKKREVK